MNRRLLRSISSPTFCYRNSEPHMPSSLNDTHLACHECDLLMGRPDVHEERILVCPRCGSRLISNHANSVERSLALALAGLILLIPANLFPVLTLEVLGREQDQTIFSSAMALYRGQLPLVALCILLFAIVVPICKLLLLAYLSSALHQEKAWPGLKLAMRSYQHLDQWGMLEVYLIAVLVSVVKLVDIARVEPGLGLYSLAALIVVTSLSSIHLDKDLFWHRIDRLTRRSTDV
ncbi:MAG: paraquat-inducible protein A [Oceanospirillaceae bacterium]|nr:paraquat-inducible protein A [Oceanospirillaceae bacterium]